ncbi:MAG: glycosyltransferase family 61 protein, partial [Burkholderiales bacterium]|nr:glycosyltransferase family 61 protein [Opitutaceae bacterium]
ALAARGFATVCLEELGWAEQIAVFRRARVVVAPHGAGLANLAFCAPGTRVVELVGRAYFNPVFWRLAALRGLDYRPVLARAEGGAAAGQIREDRSENKRDLTADVGAVLTALAG